MLIVYVKVKAEPDAVDPDHLIPSEFGGMATDVVEPFSPDSPSEALGFSESHQHSDDMSYVDWPRLHSQWASEADATVAAPGDVTDGLLSRATEIRRPARSRPITCSVAGAIGRQSSMMIDHPWTTTRTTG